MGGGGCSGAGGGGRGGRGNCGGVGARKSFLCLLKYKALLHCMPLMKVDLERTCLCIVVVCCLK